MSVEEVNNANDMFLYEPILCGGLDASDWNGQTVDWNGREIIIIEKDAPDIRDYIEKAMGITAVFGGIQQLSKFLSVHPLPAAGIPVAIAAIYFSSKELIDICREYNEAKRTEGSMEASHYAIIQKIQEKAVNGLLKSEDYEVIEQIVKEVERQEIEDKYTFESNKGADDLDRGCN